MGFEPVDSESVHFEPNSDSLNSMDWGSEDKTTRLPRPSSRTSPTTWGTMAEDRGGGMAEDRGGGVAEIAAEIWRRTAAEVWWRFAAEIWRRSKA